MNKWYGQGLEKSLMRWPFFLRQWGQSFKVWIASYSVYDHSVDKINLVYKFSCSIPFCPNESSIILLWLRWDCFTLASARRFYSPKREPWTGEGWIINNAVHFINCPIGTEFIRRVRYPGFWTTESWTSFLLLNGCDAQMRPRILQLWSWTQVLHLNKCIKSMETTTTLTNNCDSQV